MSAKQEMFELENMLCFSIYAASREITRLYRPVLDKFGLTYPQYLVMVVLWEFGDSTVSELGDKLLLDSGTLTPLLKRLQEAELIYRRRSTGDERKVEVGLTEKGISLKEQMMNVSKDIFTELCKTESNYLQTLQSVKALLKDAHELARRE
ncbi:MarR family winged helix-turn-helix transcriptional regulator [Cohnella luojiensis]|uniref:MarR family transcriptional regulator n=1 Tax=Cohnella luojiensis TaxID=652876 RepID=A0A4Y8LQX2_9BACL|nr:MarR family transcriptional regulator [Cohnella luojiensis]TFE23081.1 MarR family transcriptional regulator [Cohnella luojiensis]